MKKLLHILFFSFMLKGAMAQPASFYINTAVGSYSMRFTNDAIYTCTNYSQLIKTDYSGNIIWTRTVHADWWTIDDNSIYVFNSLSKIFRIDTSGNLVWVRDITFPTCPGGGTGYFGLFASHNNIYAAGELSLYGIDSSGNFFNSWCDITLGLSDVIAYAFPSLTGALWVEYILGPGNGSERCLKRTDAFANIDTLAATPFFNISYDDIVVDVIPFTDSTYLAVDQGADFSVASWNRVGLSKFREDGSTVWKKTFSSFSDTAYSIQYAETDSSNNIYLIISANEVISFTNFYISMKLDSSGNVLYSKQWTSFPSSILFGNNYLRMKFHNNNFYCPVTYSRGGNSYPALLVFDTLMNASCFLVDSIVTVPEMATYPDNFVPRSFFNTSGTSVSSTVLFSTPTNPSSLDLCAAVGIQYALPNPKSEILLTPNPFSSSLTLNFPSPQNSTALLKIFNSIGEAVVEKEIRLQDQTLNLSTLPKGIYLVSVRTENGVYNQKIVRSN